MVEKTMTTLFSCTQKLLVYNYVYKVNNYFKHSDHNPLEASYYGNRSAALMMLNRYHLALEDAQHCISLDENFVKGYLRAAKCYMMLGNPTLSIDYYDKALMRQPHNSQAVEEVLVINLSSYL